MEVLVCDPECRILADHISEEQEEYRKLLCLWRLRYWLRWIMSLSFVSLVADSLVVKVLVLKALMA